MVIIIPKPRWRHPVSAAAWKGSSGRVFCHLHPLCLAANSSSLLSGHDVVLIELRGSEKRQLFFFCFCPVTMSKKNCLFFSRDSSAPHLCSLIPYSWSFQSLRFVKIFCNFVHFSWELPKSFMRSSFPLPGVHSVLHFIVFLNTGHCCSVCVQTHVYLLLKILYALLECSILDRLGKCHKCCP